MVFRIFIEDWGTFYNKLWEEFAGGDFNGRQQLIAAEQRVKPSGKMKNKMLVRDSAYFTFILGRGSPFP